MKKLTRTVALLICMLVCGSLFACTGKSPSVPEGKTELKIYYFNGGYGGEYLQKMKEVYENYNKSAYITLTPFTSKVDPVSMIEGGNVAHDLYFLNSTGMGLAAGGYLEELTDVYKSQAVGDSETVEEKILPTYRDYFDLTGVSGINGQYYAMPWACGYGGMIYNQTTLEALFPSGYSLPRTTDELDEFGQSIIEAGGYPFVWSAGTEYWTFMFNIWWAQYEGAQGYEDYFEGVVRDEAGNASVALNAETLRQQGRLESFRLIEKYMKKTNGYSHKNCDSMDFMTAQSAFFGRGYANDKKLCAFMINGDWTDSEMKLSAAKYNQEIRFMRAPIVSALGTKLGITEAELRSVVSYVDGELSEQPAISPTGSYTAEEAIAAVTEARRMVYDVGRHMNIVLPKKAKEKELAKDFLRFFASDSASEIYVNELDGLNLPYGYEPTSATPASDFVKSLREAYPDPLPVSYYKTTSLTFAGNVYTHADNFETTVFSGSLNAQQLFDNTIRRYTVERDWENILRVSGLIS